MSKLIIGATLDDAPHISEEVRAEWFADMTPTERQARAAGVPSLGSGRIYPFADSDYVEEPWEFPVTWPLAFGIDVSQTRKAHVLAAWDAATMTLHVFDSYLKKDTPIGVHVSMIHSVVGGIRGARAGRWIRGVGDLSAPVRDADRTNYLQAYRKEGLLCYPAHKGNVESGIAIVSQMFHHDQLKVSRSCTGLIDEIRQYQRDKRQQIVKEKDDRLDALRYLVGALTHRDVWRKRPEIERAEHAAFEAARKRRRGLDDGPAASSYADSVRPGSDGNWMG